jgi:hypothetical protein
MNVNHQKHRYKARLCLFLIVILLCGCSTDFQPKTKLTDRKYPSGFTNVKKVSIEGFKNQGGECFKQTVREYLAQSNWFQVTYNSSADEDIGSSVQESVDYIITGEINKFVAGSNAGDRNIAIGYFTAFIITAPIAVGLANTNWEGYAIASASMKIVDASTSKSIWEKQHTIMIKEKDKSVIPQEEIHAVMLKIVCNNIATEMMNGFMHDYVSVLSK